jgi:hypothetical protein
MSGGNQTEGQSLAWCGAEDGLSDMLGIEVLTLRLRGTEPRRSRVVGAKGNLGSSCREDTSGWRVESNACRRGMRVEPCHRAYCGPAARLLRGKSRAGVRNPLMTDVGEPE